MLSLSQYRASTDIPAEDCGTFDPLCGLGNFAKGQIYDFVKSMADGAVSVLESLTTFWLELPSPTVTSDSVNVIQQSLSWYTFAFALIGIFIALGRMVWTQQFGSGLVAGKMIINLIIVTAVYATAFSALIVASDSFANWMVEKATGAELTLTGLLNVEMVMAAGIGPALLLALVAFLGSVANVIFMLLRAVMIAVLFAFIPTLAAASASETGDQAFKKAQGYLLAFVLFKPVAGVIYALGFLMLTNPPAFTSLDEAGVALFNTAVGVMTLLVAALALPALVKFIVPVAANGTSSAFSGAGAMGAAVAAGGAVVAVAGAAATGGASAAAAGGSAAASQGGNAASGGNTSSNSTPSSGGESSSTSSGGKSSGSSAVEGGGSSTDGGGSSQPGGGSAASQPSGGGSSSSSGGGSGQTGRVMADLAAAGGSQGSQGMDEAAEEQR